MSELYQNAEELSRELTAVFPRKILGSAVKNGKYESIDSWHALTSFRFVQINSRRLVTILAVDIDNHDDASAWFEHDLPQPSWTVWTDRGVQFAWILEKPILAEDHSTMKYAKDVLRKIAYALDADPAAIGLNRVFRNPVLNKSRFAPSRVNLRDFSNLQSPPIGWGRSPKPPRDLFGNRATPAVADFSTMGEGDGRNVALFDALRFWAYDAARTGNYDEFDLAHRAFVLNSDFKTPMSEKEVNAIIGSIDRFIEYRYATGGYMATTTAEQRSKIAALNGSKGGATTAKKRKADTEARLKDAVEKLQDIGIKITVSQLAKVAKAGRDQARAFLAANGYINKGGSTGWTR